MIILKILRAKWSSPKPPSLYGYTLPSHAMFNCTHLIYVQVKPMMHTGQCVHNALVCFLKYKAHRQILH